MASVPVFADQAEGVARHIARVAARLFASQGYDATSMRRIAEAVGVTKPTLYYYYGSKEGLAHAVLLHPLEAFVERLRQIVEGQKDPVAMMVAVVETHFQFCRDDPDRARFVYALFFGPLGSGLAGELKIFTEQMLGLLTRAVGRLVAAGLVDERRADRFQRAIRGLTLVPTLDFLYRGAPLGADLAERSVADLLDGFRNGSTEPDR